MDSGEPCQLCELPAVGFTAVGGRAMFSCRAHLGEVDRLLLALVTQAA
jgi:hypothetical protein